MGWTVKAIPRPLYRQERKQVHIKQEAWWTLSRSGRVQKISTQPGFDPRTIQPVASRYTD
jgi:hypothetical protein